MAGGNKPIRVGVVGVGRGSNFAVGAPYVGMELVALCDTWEERLIEVGKRFGVATYTDYDAFLSHDMDAVILANYFHEHAPFAVKALERGLHVMSECAACHTLAEGVALARAFEKSGRIYLFAENYPYMAYNQEMRRLYREGTVGEFRYGEGEYIHPFGAEDANWLAPGYDHWRNWIPATYYCTHAIGPVMFITDTRPVKVNGFVVPYDYDDPHMTNTVRRMDTVGVLILRMDNGAVVKAMQFHLRGHGNFTRIHGNRGLMECGRGADQAKVRLHIESFDAPDGKAVEKVYEPDFPELAERAHGAGHGGGDFFTMHHFAEAIRTGEQPYLDVYRGIDMSIAGILAWRSALNNSAPLDIPDLRKEEVRRRYERDDWSPDPARKGPGQPPSSILGEIAPSKEAVDFARKVWRSMGYFGE
jgi:predicted dehydrogenase